MLKSRYSFLFTILLFSIMLLSLNSCEDKKTKPTLNSTENTNLAQNRLNNIPFETPSNHLANTYMLQSNHITYKVAFQNSTISIDEIHKPIILLTLFKSSCKPCMIQHKTLTAVGEKYKQSLFILNLLETQENKRFSTALHQSLGMKTHTTQALTVIYKHGQYYSHFEGLVPTEMLVHDIQEAIKS